MNQSIHKIQAAKIKQKQKTVFVFSGIIFSSVLVLIFLIITKGVKLEVTPREASDNAEIELISGLGMTLGQKVYSFSGPTQIKVSASGFISELISITEDNQASFIEIYLREAPARLNATSQPFQNNSRWFVDDKFITVAEEMNVELAAGKHTIKIDNPYYYTDQKDIDVKKGEILNLVMELSPVPGQIQINTVPSGASIALNGFGTLLSPQKFDVSGGRHKIYVSHPDYEGIDDVIEITNKNSEIERNYKLRPKKVKVTFKLNPSGGILMLNGMIITETGSLSVLALTEHNALYTKPGYTSQNSKFSFAPNENGVVELNLKKDIGILKVRNSQNAIVSVDGKIEGVGTLELKLLTVKHRVKITKAGYRSQEYFIVPDSRSVKMIEVTLIPELQARLDESPDSIKNSVGMTLALFIPDNFEMGAPRSDRGQRANEFQKQIILDKPFYASVFETTNGQFKKFSGEQTKDKRENYPIVNITWEQAARFCNWLSQREGLKEVYQFKGDSLVSFNINGDGYRLPTEAEWEWLTRKAGREVQTRFAWGDSYTIPTSSGNLADEKSRGLVKRYIPDYNDAFEKLAPVGSFNNNASGLYDLAGNVSEWVHDFYRIIPPTVGQVYHNPYGPESGESHVIKGSNWRSATVTELRGAYRETSKTGRDDLGFRVVRYLYGKGL